MRRFPASKPTEPVTLDRIDGVMVKQWPLMPGERMLLTVVVERLLDEPECVVWRVRNQEMME